MTKKHQIKILIGLLILVVSFAFQTLQKKETTNSEAKNIPTLPFVSITPLQKSKQFAHVVRVIDGDTIVIVASGSSTQQTVRYIGMDTPEIHHPKKPVQCFGKEAAEKNQEIVLNKDIYMIKDVSETDRYGRLLRYIYLPNKESTTSAIFINEYLVLEGYAHAATFPPDVAYANLFVKDEEKARLEQKGLWSQCP